jgi:site-specific DNA recombinase
MGRRRKVVVGDERLAVAYLRASTEEQHLGPEAQRAAIETWATSRGVQVASWHEDKGVSGGAELADRPALLSALEELGKRGAGLLVVAKRDRLARDVLKAGAIEAAAAARGARVVSADGVADGSDPTAILLRQLLDSFAQFEREMIRARTRAALAAKKAKGQRVGTVPHGRYLSQEGSELVEYEPELRAQAQARDLRAQGLTLRAVAARLANEQLLSRGGRPYGPQSVANMLRTA